MIKKQCDLVVIGGGGSGLIAGCRAATLGKRVVVLEKDCTTQKLYELIRSLMADEDRRREMSRKLHTMVRLDSAERICDIVEQLTQSGR